MRPLLTPGSAGTTAGSPDVRDGSADLADDELAELYRFPEGPDRAWVRAIFIASADGSAQGPDGASASLSGRGDRRVFELQRSLCDVVLVGAGTARTEGYRPAQPTELDTRLRRRLGLTPTPTIAVVSRSLSLDAGLLAPAPAGTILVTTEDARPVAGGTAPTPDRVVRAGTGDVDLASALDELARRGLRRVLCEGGPTLLSHLVRAGRLDELCLTIAPTLVGGDGPRIMAGRGLDRPPRLMMAHLLEEDGALFARYLVGSR